MILIWRGWGLLAIVALFPLLASCAGLISIEPFWVFMLAAALSLLVAGAVCVHFGNRWNRPHVGHSLYFIPLEVWGWIYLSLIALYSLFMLLAGLASITGMIPAAKNQNNPNGPIYATIVSGVVLGVLVTAVLVLIRSARSTSAPSSSPDADDF